MMELADLRAFFMWCTIINVGLLMFWTLMFLGAPGLVYRTQKRWIAISQEQFTVVMYGFLGLFKVLVIVFNVVPLVALAIIG